MLPLKAYLCFVIVACSLLQSANGNTVCGLTPSSSMISTSTNGTNRNIQATGCPGYNWTLQSTPNTPQYQCYSFSIPLYPVINNNTIYVGVYYYDNQTSPLPNSSVILNQIGIASNGVALFGNSDAMYRNAYTYESMSFDQCNGHPQQFGEYHYHSVPGIGCVYNDTPGQHSPLFGFMADGIPIYGIYGDNGTMPTNLDMCGGHTDNTHAFYHYHATNYTYPYLVNCLRGCLNGSNMLQTMPSNIPACVPAPTQYNYASLVSVWSTLSSYTCTTVASVSNTNTGSSAVSKFANSVSPVLLSLTFAVTLIGKYCT